MEAKELRIGNYIEITSGFGEWQVMEVKLDDIQLCIEDNEFFNERYARPIPITEDWLRRFGFDENSTSFNKYTLRLKKQSKYLFYKTRIIKTVCQLQNLYFALTGDELKTNIE